MITIERYTVAKATQWDALVRESKSGTFLFERGYMDYHSDRFSDHSLMYYDDKGRLLAALPANERDQALYSHQGLTYGGLVLTAKVTAEQVLQIFDATIGYLPQQGFTSWYYKPMPTIYHQCPAEEDEYALWRHDAQLVICNLACTVPLNGTPQQPPFERRRRRGVVRAQEQGYRIVADAPLEVFWPIMVDNLLERYDASPVHTLDEMQLLQARFPDRIKCYLCTSSDGTPQAGAVVFLTNRMTVHVQYGHATHQGKAEGALDLLYTQLIEQYREAGYHYFDFGTSNEQGGRILNESLIAQKEGFGGRGIAYRTYRMDIPRNL